MSIHVLKFCFVNTIFRFKVDGPTTFNTCNYLDGRPLWFEVTVLFILEHLAIVIWTLHFSFFTFEDCSAFVGDHPISPMTVHIGLDRFQLVPVLPQKAFLEQSQFINGSEFRLLRRLNATITMTVLNYFKRRRLVLEINQNDSNQIRLIHLN